MTAFTEQRRKTLANLDVNNSAGLRMKDGQPASPASAGATLHLASERSPGPNVMDQQTHRQRNGPYHSDNPAVTYGAQAAASPKEKDIPSFASLPPSPIFPLKAPTSFLGHRRATHSIDSSLPRQTFLKGLQPRPTSKSGIIPPVSIAPALSKSLNPKSPNAKGDSSISAHLRSTSITSSQRLANALNDMNSAPNNGAKTPSTARFTALQSPCFFHERFDDAINIERVLEEISYEDDGMSSVRLMETATSVREISKQLQRKPIKRAVRNIMIITKARDNSLVTLTRELAEWLLTTPRYGVDVGVNVYVDHKLRTSKRFDSASLIVKDSRFQSMLRYWTPDLCWTSPEKFDLVLTLGGDGTVLFTSYLFQRIVPPILSFSLGSLGFLTNFAFGEYKTSLNRIMGDAGMKVNLRMRFTCTVFRADPSSFTKKRKSAKTSKNGSKKRTSGEDVDLLDDNDTPYNTSKMVEAEQFEVLNELVIDRGPSPYVSNLTIYADDEPLTVVQADGCIFSTPTGSTAYSLSAGGPLTHPSIPGILISPICPHTLSFRPMVLSDTLMLKVCVPRDSRSTAYASFDGKGRVELRRGDLVQVEAGRYPFPTVVSGEGVGGEWFESVRRALRWNTRGAMQKAFGSETVVAGPNEPSDSRGAGGISSIQEGNEDEDDENDDDNDGGDVTEDEEEEHDEEEEWDINPDPIDISSYMVDSGIGASEADGSTRATSISGNSSCASPKR
ncbi:NAD(+) kinase [Agyrium rufum]|nr:NAD(+) kinase [Agyrium rufum]